MPLRIGLIGLGVISRFYLSAIAECRNAELVAVCDRQPEKLREFDCKGLSVATDSSQLFEQAQLDAVIITTPNDQHPPLCQAALHAGLHVLCEKPLAILPSDARRLSEQAECHQRVLMTAFHRRYNHNLVRDRSEINLDRLQRVELEYLEDIEEHAGADSWYLDPQRCGGGCLADNGPNAFDTLRWLLGPLAVEQAHAEWQDGIDIRAQIALRTTAGLPVNVKLDWAYPGERKCLHLHFLDGAVHSTDFLAGFEVFKESLQHEYRAILADFIGRTQRHWHPDEAGLAAAILVSDGYRLLNREETSE